jgi:hypothetical protein
VVIEPWHDSYMITSLTGRVWTRTMVHNAAMKVLRSMSVAPAGARAAAVGAVLEDVRTMRPMTGMIPAAVAWEVAYQAMLKLAQPGYTPVSPAVHSPASSQPAAHQDPGTSGPGSAGTPIALPPGMTNDITRGWDKQAVRGYVRDAIKQNRAAWDLVPSLRVAIIAQRYTSIVSNQAVETIETIKLGNLWTDMLEAADLLGESA